MTPPLVVLDTGIYLLSLLSANGPSGRLLEIARMGAMRIAYGPELLEELNDVLLRPTVQKSNPRYTSQDVKALLGWISVHADMSSMRAADFKFPRVPKDEHVINLALDSQADFLVTRDKDLLELSDGESAESIQIQVIRPMLPILDPVDMLLYLAENT